MPSGQPNDIELLTLDQVLTVHANQLALYGGAEGFVDKSVVESAVHAPQWTSKFGGDVSDCAAAYLFHLATTQGFADGNKRTGVAAAIVFLALNGYRVAADDPDLYELAINVATGSVGAEDTADWFRQRLAPIAE